MSHEQCAGVHFNPARRPKRENGFFDIRFPNISRRNWNRQHTEEVSLSDCDFRRLDDYLFQGAEMPADIIGEELDAVRQAAAPESISKLENSSAKTTLRLGTAGWNVPSTFRERIAGEGSHLERYARALNAVEINTSFHRPHRRTTYEKWSRATPSEFRFAVKVPKSVTHVDGLANPEIQRFVDETAGLGEKLAVFLIQFPPSKSFDESEAHTLFASLQARTSAHLVCEPRHASWFTPDVDQWLAERRIARVAADPTRLTNANLPGGWQGLRYFRLHGSPRVYYSAYDEQFLSALGERLSTIPAASEAWCIFDNTAQGAAMENALFLKRGQTRI